MTRITEKETIEFGTLVVLYRYECSCGRKGVFTREPSRAMMRASDHRCRLIEVGRSA